MTRRQRHHQILLNPSNTEELERGEVSHEALGAVLRIGHLIGQIPRPTAGR